MKTFNIPDFYRSRIITPIKEFRRKNDKLKRDYAPTLLDFGPVQFLIARHFGFCYGVENAIDIAYKAIWWTGACVLSWIPKAIRSFRGKN
jgi:4-hydroxy-3-methylbut-2-enyl diphosphate reductase